MYKLPFSIYPPNLSYRSMVNRRLHYKCLMPINNIYLVLKLLDVSITPYRGVFRNVLGGGAQTKSSNLCTWGIQLK